MISDLAKKLSKQLKEDTVKIELAKKSLELTDSQLEAWKTMPREEALKEAIKLFRNQGLEPSAMTAKLNALKFLCEIQGVFVSQQQTGANIVAIKIIVNGEPIPQKPAIAVTCT